MYSKRETEFQRGGKAGRISGHHSHFILLQCFCVSCRYSELKQKNVTQTLGKLVQLSHYATQARGLTFYTALDLPEQSLERIFPPVQNQMKTFKRLSGENSCTESFFTSPDMSGARGMRGHRAEQTMKNTTHRPMLPQMAM